MEIAEATYTWVLCDDDYLNFSHAGDLLQVLESEKFDLIEVGSPVHQPWEAGFATTTQETVKHGYQYFNGLSFVPAVIFRTSLFDSDCLRTGYDLVRSFYPQFSLLIKALCMDSSIYFVKQPLVERNKINESTFSPLFWYANWIDSCSFIEDPIQRKEAIRQVTQDNGYFKSLAFWIAFEKHYNPIKFWEKITTIFMGYSAGLRTRLLLLLPIMLIPLPLPLLLLLRNLVYRLMRVPKENIPPVIINDRTS